ncbi:hypothetical protein K438DRAFT_1774070 [Mycena galopus ATCC 62051]|nr:hypothetical protein K438DRAFT_1774070 [Mycena galopus ATCC 62051]
MEETIDHMITLLTAAAVQSEGIPTRAVILVTYQEPTGQCGHPRIEINPSFLAYGLDLRGPKGLAPVAGVSVRRDEIEVCQVRIPQIDKDELQKTRLKQFLLLVTIDNSECEQFALAEGKSPILRL